VEVKVIVPRNLNTRQQHLFQELAKEEPEPLVQSDGSLEHDEGLLKKLWHTFTDRKQEQQKD
jgi:hypothetical protein